MPLPWPSFPYTNRNFRPLSRFILEMIQDRAIVTMERQYERVCDLPSGTILDDRERPLTNISRLRYYLMLNISETGKDTDVWFQ